MSEIFGAQLIKGGNYSDARGEMAFVNEFKPADAQRFYTIKHPSTAVVRAWQGHEFEQKYFFPLTGQFLIAFVQIDNFEQPSINLGARFVILDAEDTCLLKIPAGYANGLKAVTPNAMVGVFSGFELEKSVNEKRRYDPNLWFDWQKNYIETHQINRIY